MTLAPSYIANYDSSSAMVRAIARHLKGRPSSALGLPVPYPVERSLLLTRFLPDRAKELLLTVSGGSEAHPPRRMDRISGERVARWVVDLYPRRRYPAVAIGSSGGAIVHLCAALGIPWLPQTFLAPMLQPSVHPDEPKAGMGKAIEPGIRLLDANPKLQLHHMHDANQDRLMLHGMTYFRVKWRELPEAYEEFIEENLEPGGTLYLFECERRWPTTRIGDRHVFQHGALGGATPEEFLHGSERVEAYLARYGSHRRRWDSPEPNGESPEAEWGFEPALRPHVERLAARGGRQLVRVIYEEPEHLSPLVADLYAWWYRMRNIPARRLLVESFILLEPHWALRTGSIPFWLKFNMEPSYEWLEEFLETREFDEIYLTLFSHGVDCVGLPPVDRWRRLLARAKRRGRFLGFDPEQFPRDIGSISEYHRELKSLPARYPLPGPLTLDQLEDFVRTHEGAHPVRWERREAPKRRTRAPQRPLAQPST
jgi:hypothetical protein